MCAAVAGWSAENGQQILQKCKYQDELQIQGKAYKGIPLPRDSMMLLKPPCVTNHPVAYGKKYLSIQPRKIELGIQYRVIQNVLLWGPCS
jgi:hypothetical protein